jgi:hypothetical protein
MLFDVLSHERSDTHFMTISLLGNSVIRRGAHNVGEWFGLYVNLANQHIRLDAFNAQWVEKQCGASIIKGHCARISFEVYFKLGKLVYVLRDSRDVMTPGPMT